MCEKHAAEHEMFECSHQELMKWMETCRQQLMSNDVTNDTADRWVCMLSVAVTALVLCRVTSLARSFLRFS